MTSIWSNFSNSVAKYFARSWSSFNLGAILFSAISPAAAKKPACLSPPPINFLLRLALLINVSVPATIEPTGAHNPFDKQNVTESE